LVRKKKLPEKTDEPPEKQPEKQPVEELSVKGETPDGKLDEKPVLKKKSDDEKATKIDELNTLEEFDPEIDS
jgi:hypothetical protein